MQQVRDHEEPCTCGYVYLIKDFINSLKPLKMVIFPVLSDRPCVQLGVIRYHQSFSRILHPSSVSLERNQESSELCLPQGEQSFQICIQCCEEQKLPFLLSISFHILAYLILLVQQDTLVCIKLGSIKFSLQRETSWMLCTHFQQTLSGWKSVTNFQSLRCPTIKQWMCTGNSMILERFLLVWSIC